MTAEGGEEGEGRAQQGEEARARVEAEATAAEEDATTLLRAAMGGAAFTALLLFDIFTDVASAAHAATELAQVQSGDWYHPAAQNTRNEGARGARDSPRSWLPCGSLFRYALRLFEAAATPFAGSLADVAPQLDRGEGGASADPVFVQRSLASSSGARTRTAGADAPCAGALFD